MNVKRKITGARIFDDMKWHDGPALVVEAGLVDSIVPANSVDDRGETVDARGSFSCQSSPTCRLMAAAPSSMSSRRARAGG